MCDKIFELANVSVFYGKKQALSNISMNILRQKVTAFIGPSGCGKSTLLRCLNRMNELIEDCCVEGKILLNHKDIQQQNVVELRTDVGMVFQKANPFPMSIYENIAYGPRCQGVKDKRVIDEIVYEALEKAALWDEVKNRLHTSALSLSGGQQQRLCIARALAMKPKVLLMDEPTSALDPIATSKIESLIEQLKKDYTIVIVTHSMQQAARVSDYTAFFLMGEVVEFDKTCNIFQKPQDIRTKQYITGRFG